MSAIHCNLVFVLGAADPEMNEIESILRAKFIPYVYATLDGARVRADNAYRANSVLLTDKGRPLTYCTPIEDFVASTICLGNSPVTVECSFIVNDPKYAIKLKADHHNPGDPGFGQPVEKYFESSSIGQVIQLLNKRGVKYSPSTRERMIAAADHCLGAAYRNQCPGVEREALLAFRVDGKYKFQKRSHCLIMDDIRKAIVSIDQAKQIEPGLVDLRGLQIAELPEASAFTGTAVLTGPFIMPDGRLKYNLLSCTEEQGRKFLNKQYISDLDEVYGDPCRGIVGGYIYPRVAITKAV